VSDQIKEKFSNSAIQLQRDIQTLRATINLNNKAGGDEMVILKAGA
jgi:hypothetical protein